LRRKAPPNATIATCGLWTGVYSLRVTPLERFLPFSFVYMYCAMCSRQQKYLGVPHGLVSFIAVCFWISMWHNRHCVIFSSPRGYGEIRLVVAPVSLGLSFQLSSIQVAPKFIIARSVVYWGCGGIPYRIFDILGLAFYHILAW
jgi:branched-subunit amino acid transport protein AzlD